MGRPVACGRLLKEGEKELGSDPGQVCSDLHIRSFSGGTAADSPWLPWSCCPFLLGEDKSGWLAPCRGPLRCCSQWVDTLVAFL